MRHFIALLLILCGTVSGADYILENQLVRFEFTGNGALAKIVNLKSGRAVTQQNPHSLWQVELFSTAQPIPAIEGAFPAKFNTVREKGKQKLIIFWDKAAIPGGVISVTAEVELPDDSALASWKASLVTEGTPAPWVKKIIFPRLSALESLGDDYLAYGEDMGRIVRFPGKRMNLQELHYPGRWDIPFAAYFGSAKAPRHEFSAGGFSVSGFLRGPFDDETGIFFAPDDDEAMYKVFLVSADRKRELLNLGLANYPALPHWPMDSKPREGRFEYSMPYAVSFGTFLGGIGRIAELYRAMVKNRPFMKRPALSPDRREEGTFWAKFYFGANKAVPEILKMRKFLQIPLKTHWVRYGAHRFDDDNLEYLPTLAHFREGTATLRQAGIGVAPYVCCAIWDPYVYSYHDRGMERAAAMTETGSPLFYNARNVWMDPASPLWQKEYIDITDKLFGQFGTDGQYLDVMGTAGQLSFNTALHPANGGNYWSKGNIQLLEKLRAKLSRNCSAPFLCTEGFSELYIGLVDYYLMLDLTRYSWHGKCPNDPFPFISMIYHDKAMIYGSDCAQQIPLDMLRWEMGTSFIWGVQLTYSSLFLKELNTPHDRYTKELAQAWYRSAYRFLGSGVKVESAEAENAADLGEAAFGVVSKPHTLTLKGDHLNFPWRGPSVLSGAWRDSAGNYALVMTNITGEEQDADVVIRCDAINSAGKTLWQTWPLPVKRLRKAGPREMVKLTLPKESAMILELRDENPPEIRPLEKISWIAATADANGKFPAVKLPDRAWFGCDSSILRIKKGEAELVDEKDQPRRMIPVNWVARESLAGPRGDLYRSFHLLRPVGVTMEGDAVIRLSYPGNAAFGILETEKGCKLHPAEGKVLFAVSGNGQIIIPEKGTLALAPGKWRFSVFTPQQPWQTPEKYDLHTLAEISLRAVTEGEKLLQGTSSLKDSQRTDGENMLSIASAITFAVTGNQIHISRMHDWLITGVPVQWQITPADVQCTLLNQDRAGQLELRPGKDEISFMLTEPDGVTNVFRLLFQKEFVYGKEKFAAASVQYAEAAAPLMMRILGKEDHLNVVCGESEFSVNVRIVNYASIVMPLYFFVESADGWELPPELNSLPKSLAPGTERNLRLHFRKKGAPMGMGKNQHVRVVLNHRNTRQGGIGCEYTLVPFQQNLKPYGSGVAEPEWSRRIRHRVTLAVQVPETKQFSLKIGSAWSTPAKLSWQVSDAKNHLVDSGALEIVPGGEKELSLKVPAPGSYIFRMTGIFFRIRPVGVTHYAYCASETEPYHFFEEAMPLYFRPEPQAENFEFSCADGGPSEPGRVVIWGPDDEKRFEYSGRYAADKYFRIPILPKDRGKVWSMRVEPVQDFNLRFRNGIIGWFSPERGALLIPDENVQ